MPATARLQPLRGESILPAWIRAGWLRTPSWEGVPATAFTYIGCANGVTTVTEWEFTADVASWVNRLLDNNRDLPFSSAKCEQRGHGSWKRRDLTILDKNERVVLTGEVKLPFRPDGGSPYAADLVKDARRKALRAQAPFFFTWNVNEFVLWEAEGGTVTWQKQKYRSWEITNVAKESHMDQPMTQRAIQFWLAGFLHDFAQIIRGTAPVGQKSPDEKFIEALESSLRLPILLTIERLAALYANAHSRSELDRWMREEQGWIIYDDPEGIRENLERSAKFSCYALVNKLVFYEALLKRYGPHMDRLSIPEHIETGEALRGRLDGYFARAKDVTSDYETVFGEEHMSIGNRIPFYADAAVPHWRTLINQIHQFDFSKLDYEVIGSIFERLIGPEERHKFGEYYTRVEVVDLINSFCIRSGTEKVMDPACGGGTFLVRAYARKRELTPARKHGQLLADLFGVDVSDFATHLTTINLATRDLVDEANYPRIARSDFFDIDARSTFVSLPRRMTADGLGTTQRQDIVVPPLDAVVGNPPYIRQEEIPKSKIRSKPRRGTKEHYQKLVKEEAGAELSGRSDIHCYFWPHASSFLKGDGHLCFLTSSQWLDVEYGFRLQEWMLSNFRILAVFESICEPWFVGARVTTVVTILQREADDEARMGNVVRFVQLRRPLQELMASDGTMAGAVEAADRFRDEVMSLQADVTNERFRARLVSQRELWDKGAGLAHVMAANGKGEDEGGERYYGGKWGVYLRAPDLWFRLLDAYGSRLVPLMEIAEIRRGITSGKDCFFFPRDCSASCLVEHARPSDFESEYGVPRKEVASGQVKLVRCGENYGEIRPIEAEYLEPEVHSLMEVGGFTVGPEDCARMIFLCGAGRGALRGTYALLYIKWGESQNYHTGASCQGRITESREWYDVTGHARGALFWPMAQQYKHAIPVNDHNLICNHNLFDITAPGADAAVLAGILNSSWCVLSKFQYGRPVGVEGNLKTEVVDVNMMLVPDPRAATDPQRRSVARAFAGLKQRKTLGFLPERRLREMAYREAGKADELDDVPDVCELDMADRRRLDDAVLQLLGVGSKRERDALVLELYRHLGEFFERTRQKEEQAIRNKKRARRRGPAKPADIAAQIYEEILDSEPKLLRSYDRDFVDRDEPFDTYEVPENGEAETYQSTMVASDHGVRFRTGKGTRKKQNGFLATRSHTQDELVALLANNGVRGFVRVPYDDGECRKLHDRYLTFLKHRQGRLRELIARRTADEEFQESIYEALVPMVRPRT